MQGTPQRRKEYPLHAKGILIAEEAGDAIRSLEAIAPKGLPLSRFNGRLILTMAARGFQ